MMLITAAAQPVLKSKSLPDDVILLLDSHLVVIIQTDLLDFTLNQMK